MSLIASDSGKNYTPPPEGLYKAVCADIVDHGMVDGKFGAKRTVELVFQLEDLNPEDDMRPFEVGRRFTLSLNEKASLSKALEQWRGKAFTPQERAGFDLERLIGVPAQVQIVHGLSNRQRLFANVTAILPLPRGATPLKVQGYTRRRKAKGTPLASTAPPATGPAEDEVPF